MFWGIFKDFILQQNAQGTSNLTPMFPLQVRVSIFFCNISLSDIKFANKHKMCTRYNAFGTALITISYFLSYYTRVFKRV